MGSNAARNYVHLECGASYRMLSKQIKRDLEKTRPFIRMNKHAAKAHDLLLAKLAFYRSILLTNDPTLSDKNKEAKEARKTAVSPSLFNRSFDKIMSDYLEVDDRRIGMG